MSTSDAELEVRCVRLALAPAAAHRHRFLLEALFEAEADSAAFSLGCSFKTMDLVATAAGLAAFANQSVEVNGKGQAVLRIGVGGATIEFDIAGSQCEPPVNAAQGRWRTAKRDRLRSVDLRLATPTATAERLQNALSTSFGDLLGTVGTGARVSPAARRTLENLEASCPAIDREQLLRLVDSVVGALLVAPLGGSTPPITIVQGPGGAGKTYLALQLTRLIGRVAATAETYVATRVVSIARLLAVADLGDVESNATQAAAALRSALDEAVNGYPFTSKRAGDLSLAPQWTNGALVVIEEGHLLASRSYAARLAARSLAQWLRQRSTALC
jgi:hypothetical protein